MPYTYLHRRADTGAVFYIGKGHGKRACATAGRGTHWQRVTAKHGRVVEVLAEWPTEAEAFEHEKFLIACFRDLGAPLVNKTDGGEGPSGRVPSADTKAKIGAKHRGRVPSADTRAKMSAAQSLRRHTPETLARMSLAQRGHPVSELTRSKMSAAKAGFKHSQATRKKMRIGQAARRAREQRATDANTKAPQ